MGIAEIAVKGAGALAPGDAYRALFSDKSLQFDFPDAATPGPPPSWLVRMLAALARHGTWFEHGAWALPALIVLIAGYYLARHYRDRGRRTGSEPAPRRVPAWQPSVRQARLLLEDADRLGEERRYDEAVHMLLLVSVQHIRDRRPGVIKPSLTSREIGGSPELSATARTVFSQIAEVVERSRFGGQVLGQAEFTRCRDAFERFTLPQMWQAAA